MSEHPKCKTCRWWVNETACHGPHLDVPRNDKPMPDDGVRISEIAPDNGFYMFTGPEYYCPHHKPRVSPHAVNYSFDWDGDKWTHTRTHTYNPEGFEVPDE